MRFYLKFWTFGFPKLEKSSITLCSNNNLLGLGSHCPLLEVNNCPIHESPTGPWKTSEFITSEQCIN